MRRLFFALLPNDHTKQALQQISTTLPLSSRQRIHAENWHVTLVFIGNINAALLPKIIASTLNIKMPTITLVFDQLQYWRKAEILCLTCSQSEPTLSNLVAQLSTPLSDLGLKLDTRPYCPHITIARHIRARTTSVFQPIIWAAEQFALVESVNSATGVIYQPLRFY